MFPDFFKGKVWIWADDTVPVCESEILGWLSPFSQRADQIRKEKSNQLLALNLSV